MLARRVFAAIALVVVTVLGLVALLTRGRADAAAGSTAAVVLRGTRATVAEALDARASLLREVASSLVRVPAYVARAGDALRSDNRADLLDQADEFRRQTGAAWALVTDETGRLAAWTRAPAAAGEDFSAGALVARALSGAAVTGIWVEPTAAGDSLFQAAAVPIEDPGAGRRHGVLVVAVPLDATAAAQLARQAGAEIVLFVQDSAGELTGAGGTLPDPAVASLLASLSGPNRDSAMDAGVAVEYDGRRWGAAVEPLLTAGGVPVGGVAALRGLDAELAAYAALRRSMLVALGAGLALALLAAWLVARRVAQPIVRLAGAARAAREGDYSARLDLHAPGEVGELARAFAGMLGELREKSGLVDYVSRPAEGRAAVARASGGNAAGDGAPRSGDLLAGRYELREELGRGAMGVVFRAWDRELGEPLALKLLRAEHAALNPSALERFRQELRLARRITHPNVVRTHDLGEDGGVYFITMELVEGASVAALLERDGRLPVAAAVAIARQLCRALDVAHATGVVHRDIKPQNLVLDGRGFLKVMDFGIARLTDGSLEGAAALTATGFVIGTPRYMAPEQLLGEPVDHRADIWAAGAVLFECLTGRPVFDAPSVVALAARHLQDTAADPRSIVPEIPEPVAAAVLRALARNPAERWPTAGEMELALGPLTELRPA